MPIRNRKKNIRKMIVKGIMHPRQPVCHRIWNDPLCPSKLCRLNRVFASEIDWRDSPSIISPCKGIGFASSSSSTGLLHGVSLTSFPIWHLQLLQVKPLLTEIVPRSKRVSILAFEYPRSFESIENVCSPSNGARVALQGVPLNL